ncbi:MAG: sulfotransferase [Proteobacteria bacterium]|nr:sulfotransferase [Pseudomonadota bacterium]MCP4920631.1 sulfotransferase [Pseudomonadota bacterium]
MQENLIFVLGPPRSGSTLLMRMLSSHTQIYSRPEPHLMTPMAHMGFYDNVDQAAFDQLQAASSLREFVADLPGGEEDYLDALRAYAETMYERMVATQPKPYFLDKTPAYTLIMPFIAKVFPKAHFVVLTRNPCSVWDSFAQSFFDGSYAGARDFNPILARYVPAQADFLRTATVPFVHVKYEDIVANPEAQLKRIYDHIGIPHEPDSANYGNKKPAVEGGLGDPIGVGKHNRPVTSSLEKWARHAAADPSRVGVLREMIGALDPEDIRTIGYEPETLFEPLDRVDVEAAKKHALEQAKKDTWDRYKIQRRVLVMLRKNIHHNALGQLVKKARFFCDVLLRGDGGGFSRYADRRYGVDSDLGPSDPS